MNAITQRITVLKSMVLVTALCSSLVLPQAIAGTLSLPAYSAEQLAAVAEHGSFILVATKPGCPVCARQVPAITAALSDPALQQVSVLQYNHLTEKALNTRYNVTGQSTIIVFRNGQEVSRTRGLTDETAIKAELLKAL